MYVGYCGNVIFFPRLIFIEFLAHLLNFPGAIITTTMLLPYYTLVHTLSKPKNLTALKMQTSTTRSIFLPVSSSYITKNCVQYIFSREVSYTSNKMWIISNNKIFSIFLTTTLFFIALSCVIIMTNIAQRRNASQYRHRFVGNGKHIKYTHILLIRQRWNPCSYLGVL